MRTLTILTITHTPMITPRIAKRERGDPERDAVVIRLGMFPSCFGESFDRCRGGSRVSISSKWLLLLLVEPFLDAVGGDEGGC